MCGASKIQVRTPCFLGVSINISPCWSCQMSTDQMKNDKNAQEYFKLFYFSYIQPTGVSCSPFYRFYISILILLNHQVLAFYCSRCVIFSVSFLTINKIIDLWKELLVKKLYMQWVMQFTYNFYQKIVFLYMVHLLFCSNQSCIPGVSKDLTFHVVT